MAYPASPQIETSYTAHAQGQGDNTFPGPQLDADFANVRAAMEGWIAFQKRLQRSDGALANGSVNHDQLGPGVLLGLDPPSDWVTATAYKPPDTVFESLGYYACRVAHTSGDFAADLASGYWELLVNLYDATAAQEAGNHAAAAETAQTAAETAQAAAEAAQAAAEAAAGSIVDQATVPIYGTTTVVAATDVPDGMLGLRTNGRTAAGDAGGAFYAFDASDEGPGGITDTEGKKFRLAESVVTDEMFANSTDRDDYLASLIAAGRKIYVPTIVDMSKAGVLKISDFLRDEATHADALKAAIVALGSTANAVLDLEGRYLALEEPVVLVDADFAPVTLNGYHARNIRIKNGKIGAAVGGDFSAGDYLLSLTSSTGSGMRHVVFDCVTFTGGDTDSATLTAPRGLHVDGYYHFILHNCSFYDFEERCLYETGGNGFFADLVRYQPNIAAGPRTATCVEHHSPDIYYFGGWFDWCEVAAEFNVGSVHLVGVHFSVGGLGMIPVRFHDTHEIVITACDFDSCYIELGDDFATRGTFDGCFVGNDWGSGEALPAGHGAITFFPDENNSVIVGFSIIGNHFNYTGSSGSKRVVAIDNTNGTILATDADNQFFFQGNSVGGNGNMTPAVANGMVINAMNGWKISGDANGNGNMGVYEITGDDGTASIRAGASSNLYLGATGADRVGIFTTAMRALVDNALGLGAASHRWTTVYAATGTINTSDFREKQDFRSLTEAELRVARRLFSLVCAYRWRDAVAKEGDAAHWHVGLVAQQVLAAFEEEGLDGLRYGLVSHDVWEGGDRYGVRYDEINLFMMAALGAMMGA